MRNAADNEGGPESRLDRNALSIHNEVGILERLQMLYDMSEWMNDWGWYRKWGASKWLAGSSWLTLDKHLRIEINRKRKRNALAAPETAEMFLQKGQLTGHSQSADGPFGWSLAYCNKGPLKWHSYEAFSSMLGTNITIWVTVHLILILFRVTANLKWQSFQFQNHSLISVTG